MIALAILSVFAAALIAPFVSRLAGSQAGWFIALLPPAWTGYFASLLPLVASGKTETFVYDWAPAPGIRLSLHADGLGLLFALLISGGIAGHALCGRRSSRRLNS